VSEAFLIFLLGAVFVCWIAAEACAWRERRRNRRRIRYTPSRRCERAGSIESFYRLMRDRL
jgi:hypothetical protein